MIKLKQFLTTDAIVAHIVIKFKQYSSDILPSIIPSDRHKLETVTPGT